MTAEKTGHNGQKEQGTATCRCLPQRFLEMMAKCGDDRKRECGAMMQEMMEGGCCRPGEK